MNRSSDEYRRSNGASAWHGGGASRRIRAPVDSMSSCKEGRNLCPNQQPCKEKFKTIVGHALGGFSGVTKENTGGGAKGSGNFKPRVSFKYALGKTEGNILGNQAYLVDLTKEIPSMVIKVQETETSCPQEQVMDPSIKGMTNVLDACTECGVKCMVLTSSIDAVYMDPNRDPCLVVHEDCWSD
ncbi:hypothetical protein KI387_022192, partial [Taxus chinensis]